MDRLSTKGQMIDQIDLRGVPHSGFDRSNHNYGSGKLGAIIPTRLDEVYPGDRIKGRPEIVANFEPLAAPLMGSMVLKQESFFVPYPQLWRHAYKFFTGKNGFSEEMPSISPNDIWNIYNENVHNCWSTIGDNEDDTTGFGTFVFQLNAFYHGNGDSWAAVNNEPFKNSWDYAVGAVETALRACYTNRKMLDLVLPALDIFKRFADSDTWKQFAIKTDSDIDSDAALEFGSAVGDCLFEFFNYFHGPSSLFDYLGWPVPTNLGLTAKIGEYKLSQIASHGVTNVFSYAIYRNLIVYGSFDLEDFISSQFSYVPLVFNPFKAYYLIWYWNYRDQLLETGILDPEEDEFLGSEITSNIVLYCTMMRQRCWFKDTFTTALTNTGDGNLLVPTISDEFGDGVFKYYDSDDNLINTTDHSQAVAAGALYCELQNSGISYKIPMNYLRGGFDGNYGSNATVDNGYISLDLFDRIKRLRSYVQKRLILGYEVDDVIYSSFMVKLSSVRMHVPELLGRGRDSVQMNTIINNTSTDLQIAGDKTATAWAHGTQSEMNYFAEEWGLTLSFMTILPIQSYAGGMQRLYLKRDPLDYAWPEFATMGMDAVYNTELAALGTRLTDEQGLIVFGYQGRYYDLKSRMDEEHGRLLTDLNYLTFSREWDSDNPPKLNYMFVHCWPRLDGFVIDSPLLDVFRYDCYNASAWERRFPVPSEIIG